MSPEELLLARAESRRSRKAIYALRKLERSRMQKAKHDIDKQDPATRGKLCNRWTYSGVEKKFGQRRKRVSPTDICDALEEIQEAFLEHLFVYARDVSQQPSSTRCTVVDEMQPENMQESLATHCIDIGVQCSFEYIVQELELFTGKGEGMKKRQAISQLQKAPFQQHLSHVYHVHTRDQICDKIKDQTDIDPARVDHFSCCAEPQDIAVVASRQIDQLELLASRFVGVQICGVRWGLKERPSKHCFRASDRHVQEAFEIANAAPSFRIALEKSSQALLFDGIDGLSREKTTLLDLARVKPEMWKGRAQTAVDFVTRLARKGVIQNMSEEMRDLIWKDSMTWIPAPMETLGATFDDSPSDGEESRADPFVRSFSSPPTYGKRTWCVDDQVVGFSRTSSSPLPLPTPCKHMRSVGTSLRPQDHCRFEKYPSLYSRVSFAKNPTEVIPSCISLRELSDYWRYVAGGDHTDTDLERRATEAEHNLKTLRKSNMFAKRRRTWEPFLLEGGS